MTKDTLIGVFCYISVLLLNSEKGCIIMANTNEKGNVFMKFYNVYFICKTCYPVLCDSEITAIKPGQGFWVENWGECQKALNELRKIPIFIKLVDDIYDTMTPYERSKVRPDISDSTGKKFYRLLNELKTSVDTVINLYELVGNTDSAYGIDVKIPECDSLKEYMDYLKEVDFIFTQCPYLLDHDEQIKFNNVDVGSQWLSFFVISSGTFYILNNLAKLIQKAIALKSHLTTLKMQEEMLHTMSSKNQVTDEVIDIFKTMKHTLVNKYVEELESEIGELSDGEERGKVEKSLEKLVNLMDKGVEIYSSIETPNEIKLLFPNSEENLILPDNLVKLIESKEENMTE